MRPASLWSLPRVPWWAQASAVVGPAALLGVWLAPAATWWLTPAAVTVAGIAHIVTAAGLRPAYQASRGLLAAGGALTVLSGWLPMVGHVGFWHITITNTAWVTLCVWPALIAPDRQPLPPVLRRWFGESLTVALGALLLLCVVSRDTVIGAGETYGVPQRLLMTAQSAVPLLITVGLKLKEGRGLGAPDAKDAPRDPPSAGKQPWRPGSHASHPAEPIASGQPDAKVRLPAGARRQRAPSGW